jgi:hypothetical protein
MAGSSSHTRTRQAALIGVETVATLALALWIGGLVALGAFAAPTIFHALELEVAGTVMGTIFVRFHRMVLVLGVIFGVAEAVRVVLERERGVLRWARLVLGMSLVAVALVSSLWITPGIFELFAAGGRPGAGPEGETLDRLHRLSSALGKVAVVYAAAWIALGVLARRRAAPPPAA